MRTNVFDRTWEIKLRPINSLAGLFVVGNDTSANRVDSIIPDARITEQFGLIGRNLDALLTDTWRPVTAPPAAAVQGQAPASGLFSFDKYSSATLLADAARESSGRPDNQRGLFVVPNAHVTRLVGSSKPGWT